MVIQLVAKESNANENNAGIRRLFVLFLDKHYISQVIHFKGYFYGFDRFELLVERMSLSAVANRFELKYESKATVAIVLMILWFDLIL